VSLINNIMLNLLFKSYYVFVKDMPNGVAGAVFFLSVPLGLNVTVLLLFCIPSVTDLTSWSAILSALLIGVITFITGMLLRYIYITREKYKSVPPIRIKFFYGLFGIVYYVTSILLFVYALVYLYSPSPR
jgi:hypothetical protein